MAVHSSKLNAAKYVRILTALSALALGVGATPAKADIFNFQGVMAFFPGSRDGDTIDGFFAEDASVWSITVPGPVMPGTGNQTTPGGPLVVGTGLQAIEAPLVGPGGEFSINIRVDTTSRIGAGVISVMFLQDGSSPIVSLGTTSLTPPPPKLKLCPAPSSALAFPA
jgi:hypothetical protein